MKSKLIAMRYAKAIIRLIQQDEYPNYLNDISFLKNLFDDDGDSAKTLNSFLFPTQQRLELAGKVVENLNQKEVWGNLFHILIKKHRFSIILPILKELEDMIYEKQNIKKVRLTIAHEQPEEILDLIRKKVESILSQKVLFKKLIDSSILGGFVAKTDSIVIDGSIKNNLVKLIKISEL